MVSLFELIGDKFYFIFFGGYLGLDKVFCFGWSGVIGFFLLLMEYEFFFFGNVFLVWR